MIQPGQIKNTVLYADDDPDDIELICNGLAPYTDFIDVKTFGNGAELLSHLNSLSPLEKHPCLVILDVNMPLLNGLETLKLIREQKEFESVSIILFTTYVSNRDRQFIDKYNSRVLIKPIDAAQFNSIIQEFLSHCHKDIPEAGSGN